MQCRQHLGQARVEPLEASRIARDVAAMPVFAVEIDEVDDDQSPVRHVPKRVEQMVEVRVVAGAVAFVAGVAMGEDVARLADRDDRAPVLRGPVEERALGAARPRSRGDGACAGTWPGRCRRRDAR